jgi:hypothetical protein
MQNAPPKWGFGNEAEDKSRRQGEEQVKELPEAGSNGPRGDTGAGKRGVERPGEKS